MDIISMAQQANRIQAPDGTATRPVHGFIERRENDSFVFQQLAEIFGLTSA